jgi:hypothetical protein
VTYVNSRSAPFLLLHSQTDPVVTFGQSVEIARLYRSVRASAAVKAIEAPNTHAFWNETGYFPETMKQAVEYRTSCSIERRRRRASSLSDRTMRMVRRARLRAEDEGRG